MPSGALGRIYSGRHPHMPPSRRHPAWQRSGVGPRRGHLSPPRKKSDPDGSPLENWYLPCGLFLLSRTFPSGPLPRLGTAGLERKPRKSVRRQATIRSLTGEENRQVFPQWALRVADHAAAVDDQVLAGLVGGRDGLQRRAFGYRRLESHGRLVTEPLPEPAG